LLRDAQDYLAGLPLVIEQQPGLTIAQIAMRARRLQQRTGLDLLILDHLHKIRASERYRGDPTAEVGEISNTCAELAKQINIGVLALCQLSRATESREDKRAQLSDLRHSGSLEQDADVVMFPYREAYYLLAHEPAPESPSICNGKRRSLPRSDSGGGRRNSEINPMDQSEATRLRRLRQAPRCGARTRSGTPCQRPALRGRKRCRLHGGLSPGAPRGEKNGNFKTGDWTLDAIEERKWLRSLLQSFCKGST
jgi:hypothetical protein